MSTDEEKAEQIRALFKRIDSREVTLQFLGGYPYDDPSDGPVYTSLPKYKTSDGWTVCIFDDAGSFDYVEWVESPEGWKVHYPYPVVHTRGSSRRRLPS